MAGAEREKERNGGIDGVGEFDLSRPSSFIASPSIFANSSLLSSVGFTGKDGFHLLQTTAVFAAIQNCWAPGTFIPELAHRFWRLNLQVSSISLCDYPVAKLSSLRLLSLLFSPHQILSRYRTWLESILPVPEAPASVAERVSPIYRSFHVAFAHRLLSLTLSKDRFRFRRFNSSRRTSSSFRSFNSRPRSNDDRSSHHRRRGSQAQAGYARHRRYQAARTEDARSLEQGDRRDLRLGRCARGRTRG